MKTVRRIAPQSLKRIVRQTRSLLNTVKARVRQGIGIQPLSEYWGIDRGLPVQWYYMEQFLHEFSGDIRGHCLEFQEDSYTTRFGGSAVDKLDILHLDDSAPSATIIADLTKPNEIPINYFDCIICTHVLHLIYEFKLAISELHRILKPGAVMLVSVPHISSMCKPEWNEFWRFTPVGLHLTLAEVFGADNVIVKAYGNSLTAAGALRGIVTHEYCNYELNYHDPRFAIELCAHVTKAG